MENTFEKKNFIFIYLVINIIVIIIFVYNCFIIRDVLLFFCFFMDVCLDCRLRWRAREGWLLRGRKKYRKSAYFYFRFFFSSSFCYSPPFIYEGEREKWFIPGDWVSLRLSILGHWICFSSYFASFFEFSLSLVSIDEGERGAFTLSNIIFCYSQKLFSSSFLHPVDKGRKNTSFFFFSNVRPLTILWWASMVIGSRMMIDDRRRTYDGI